MCAIVAWKFGIDPMVVLDERSTFRHVIRVAALDYVTKLEKEANDRATKPR